MPLFRRRHDESAPAAPVVEESRFASAAAGRGWQPVAGSTAFDSPMHEAIRQTTYVFNGQYSYSMGDQIDYVPQLHDVFRADRDGRTVIVANAFTNMRPGLAGARGVKGVSVCTVEIPALISVACVQPRKFKPSVMHIPEQPTGDAAFDERFLVLASPGLPPIDFTPGLRSVISAREDWIFRVHEYLFTCFGEAPFDSVDEIAQRIDDVLAVVSEFPESVMPKRVDHSQDDLLARIRKLDSVDDALAFLQQLTPDDREHLAKSDTPLAGFADVQTPEEAIARFQGLDPAKQLQILAMFERVDDGKS